MPETPKHVEWRAATKYGWKEASFALDTTVDILRYKKWNDPLARPEPTEPELDAVTVQLQGDIGTVGDGVAQLDAMVQLHKAAIMAGKPTMSDAQSFITGNPSWDAEVVHMLFNIIWAYAHQKPLDPADFL